VTAAVLWALTLAFGAMGFASAVVTGSSNLTVALALIATGICILALVVDEAPRNGRRW
jgi:hypothetical protein